MTSRVTRPAAAKLPVVLLVNSGATAHQDLLPKVGRVLPNPEIVKVEDGSTDATAEMAKWLGAKVVRHPHSRGNGAAAIEASARVAQGETSIFLDAAGGQRDLADIPGVISELESTE